jgi:hypothetical protein
MAKQVDEIWAAVVVVARTTRESTRPRATTEEQVAAIRALTGNRLIARGGSVSFGSAKAGIIAAHTTTAQRNTVPLQQVSVKGRR